MFFIIYWFNNHLFKMQFASVLVCTSSLVIVYFVFGKERFMVFEKRMGCHLSGLQMLLVWRSLCGHHWYRFEKEVPKQNSLFSSKCSHSLSFSSKFDSLSQIKIKLPAFLFFKSYSRTNLTVLFLTGVCCKMCFLWSHSILDLFQ